MLKAQFGNLIVEVQEKDEKIGSGILFGANTDQTPSQIAKVVSVGPLWMERQVEEVAEGDTVIFALSAEQPGRVLEHEGKSYQVLIPEEVIAIL